MSHVLDKLPQPRKFIWCMSLRTGTYVAAVIGIIHPTIFVSLYFSEEKVLHTWCLNVAGFMAAFLFIFSLILFISIPLRSQFVAIVWVWFSLLFTVTILVILVLLAAYYITEGKFWIQPNTAWQLILHLFFYYLIIIVHSYSVELEPYDGDDIDYDET